MRVAPVVNVGKDEILNGVRNYARLAKGDSRFFFMSETSLSLGSWKKDLKSQTMRKSPVKQSLLESYIETTL